MCGRYLIESGLDELEKRYHAKIHDLEYVSKHEVFPTDTVPVVLQNNGINEIKLPKWGFVFNNGKSQVINARSETVREKPMFRNSFMTRRILIPANAFFEWKNVNNKKVKYKISLKYTLIFSIAGIYNSFKDKNDKLFDGFVLLTTAANREMSEIHDRMPVIIPEKDENIWLNKDSNIAEIQKYLVQCDGSKLIFE